ncbi:MAG: secondary thiamine-phosphate synthase enzyme YjbQ [Gemmatimonadota bacterium]
MKKVELRTDRKRTLIDITDRVSHALNGEDGVWLLYVPHTTAGVTINEGADPDVARDILMAWERLVPENLPFRHAEGNAAAHVLSCLAGSSVLVAVEGGELELGTWQSVFFCEFDGPRDRRVWLSRV